MSPLLRRLSAAAVAAAAVLLVAGTADAATGRPTEQVTCAGQVVTIAVAPGNGGNNWGSGQIVGGGHLVLATLEYAVHDDTAGVVLDDEVVSHGRAHDNQQQIACDVASEQSRLGDIAPPGFVYPDGVTPDDLVTSSLTVTVVPRP